MYSWVHICTSPSNDYTGVACSNNNQAQLRTHVYQFLTSLVPRLFFAHGAKNRLGTGLVPY